MNNKTADKVQEEIEKRERQKIRRKRKNMKLTGSGVKDLQKIILKKAK